MHESRHLKLQQNNVYYPTFSFQCLFLRELLAMQFSRCLVGSSGLEPPTSRLSGVRSNQLSYEPMLF